MDDNRCLIEIIREGLRFDEASKSFLYKEEWEDEDRGENCIERTKREVLKAMNAVNPDLRFTLEHEEDFPNNRLPTLAFEVWSDITGLRHSYFEKSMRNQVLTQKRSSQSENSKFAILTNELTRRFQMMDKDISSQEKIEKIDHYTQQLINSGYSWQQSREVIVSSLKGIMKTEIKRKEEGGERYRTGEQSLPERLRNKLLETTQ